MTLRTTTQDPARGARQAHAEHIATLAHSYVEARDEVARLKRERAEHQCEREGYDDPNSDNPREVPPCWKMVHEEPEYDTGYLVASGGWAYVVDPDEWCDACRRREAVHRAIKPAQARMAARLGALIAATRATPC